MTISESKARKIKINFNERFSFGENWMKFIREIDERHIIQAENSLKEMLEIQHLNGKTFLDVGCGSGLFSLAAKRLGAIVFSFDCDPKSVACAQELKKRYFENDNEWTIDLGSVLDSKYLKDLGKFDIVYSCGVLHHTGNMYSALKNVILNVEVKGKLFIELYNDQGRQSKLWWKIKKFYVTQPKILRWIVIVPAYIKLWGPATIRDLILLRPFSTWNAYRKNRGMSPHIDVIDWIGGFPFEVSKPEEIFSFYKNLGFNLCVLKTIAGGHGCNQFVFQKNN